MAIDHRRDPGIVGRAREQQRLGALIDSAWEGRGGLALVSGEAGIGKTSLVRDLTGRAIDSGWLVIQGGCYDLTSTPPYGPWIEMLLRSYQPTGDLPLLPEPIRDEAGIQKLGSQQALFREVDGLLVDISAHTPLLIVLEDLHWADEASIELLRYLARQLPDRRTLIVATYREDEITRDHPLYERLPVILRESPVERITVRRLLQQDITEIVEILYRLAPSDRERLVQYLLKRSDGNPFYIGELLHELEERKTLHGDPDRWLLDDEFQQSLPLLLQQTLDAKLDRLEPDDLKRMQVAAAIGQIVPYDLWQHSTGASDAELTSTIASAMRYSILLEDELGTGYTFTHALLREALYSRIVVPVRRRLHRHVAEALIDQPRPDPDVVAHHFLRASDDGAAHWLVQAGERARHSYAWLTAIERYEAALDLIGNDPVRARERGWILYRIGMLSRADDPRRSLEYFAATRQIGSEDGDRTLTAYSTFMRGLVLCYDGDLEPGIKQMTAGMELLDELTISDLEQSGGLLTTLFMESGVESVSPSEELLQVNPGWGTYALWLSRTGGYAESLAMENPASVALDDRAVSRTIQDSRYDLHWAQGEAYAMLGQPGAADRELARAAEGYAALGHHLLVAGVVLARWHFLTFPYYTDDATARRAVDQAAQKLQGHLDDLYSDGIRSTAGITRLIIRAAMGEWGAVTERLRIATQAGHTHLRHVALNPLVAIHHYQGNDDMAHTFIRQALPHGPDQQPGTTTHSPTLETQRLAAAIALDNNNHATAANWLRVYDQWLADATLGRAESQLLWARYHQITGHRGKAQEHADRALEHASDPRQPLALLAAHRFLGALDTGDRRYDDAEEHLEQSRQLADACEIPFERALTLIEIARLRCALRDNEAAQLTLDEARSICQSLQAQPTLDVIAELQASVSTVTRKDESAYSLSPRELEVLQLLVDGRTDREIAEALFISPRTAMSHVANIRNKLGVDSRTAAAGIAIREGLV